jgi:hypothetical protein
MWEHFRSEADAKRAAARLREQAITTAAVAAGWPDAAILYADPFLGTIN